MRTLIAICLSPLLAPILASIWPGPLRGAGDSADTEKPDLKVESILITDAQGGVISPQAGELFWVRVDFKYERPVCTPYTIERTVNKFKRTSDPIDWGCGLEGSTSWSHIDGPWLMHKSGRYEVKVKVDSGRAIDEEEENDNDEKVKFEFGGTVTAEWALVEADAGRNLLGDGTGVIVGTMDGALDIRHPWLKGKDSLGMPRLVAANQNTLGPKNRPVNTTHATAVMGIALARGKNDGDFTGMAPDARYVTAEFLNRAGVPDLNLPHVFDAAGFLVENGAEVINMSWSWFSDEIEAKLGEGAVTNLLTDYLAYGQNIVCVAAVNQFPDSTQPTAPAAARNAISVGGLDEDLTRAWKSQDHGPTRDGRSKPDLLGNNAQNAVGLHSDWEDGVPVGRDLFGTSFAAPFVTGAVAQLLDYGKANGENTDHRLIKAIVMNSGVKALDSDGAPWDNTAVQALDDEQGTGILNMVRAHAMYSPGRQVGPDVAPMGHDFRSISGTTEDPYPGGRVIYNLGLLTGPPAQFDATLVWDRHTYWNDTNSNNQIDAPDDFYTLPTDTQDNLDLVLYRNGTPLISSRSTVDNVEHLSVVNLQPGVYELHVERLDRPFSGDGEEYAIAWLGEGSWTQSFTRASFATFGTGCPGSSGNPVLELVAGHKPWIDGQLQVRVTNIPRELSFGSVIMFVGFSNTEFQGLPLPTGLSSFGLGTCTGYTSFDVGFPLLSFLGTATWTFDIPNEPDVVGMHFYNQALVWDPGFNPAGYIVSNAGDGVIGGR
jgi:hypothetical protein